MQISNIKTGIDILDKEINEIKSSNIIAIASRPGMGNEILLEQIINYNTNRQKKIVAFISSNNYINKRPKPSKNFDVFYDIEKNIDYLINKIQNTKPKKNYDLIIIDDIQYYVPYERNNLINKKQGTFYKKIKKHLMIILKKLKNLADKINTPIFIGASLPPQIENKNRKDKHPTISDIPLLYENCDIIMLLYRDSYYLNVEIPIKKKNEKITNFMERYNSWENNYQNKKDQAEITIIQNNKHKAIKLHFIDLIFCN